MPKNIEIEFQITADMPPGPCPLPEPGRGAPAIEQPGLLSIEPQPIDFDYDKLDNIAEEERFIKMVQKEVEAGNITHEEAERILKSGLN